MKKHEAEQTSISRLAEAEPLTAATAWHNTQRHAPPHRFWSKDGIGSRVGADAARRAGDRQELGRSSVLEVHLGLQRLCAWCGGIGQGSIGLDSPLHIGAALRVLRVWPQPSLHGHGISMAFRYSLGGHHFDQARWCGGVCVLLRCSPGVLCRNCMAELL